MKLLFKLLVFALYVTSALAYANDSISNSKICLDANSTVEIMDCFQSNTAQNEKLLKQNLKLLKSCLSKSIQVESLVKAQEAWVRYRQAQCEFVRNKGGGSMAGIESNICFLDITEARAQYIQKAYKECVDPESALGN